MKEKKESSIILGTQYLAHLRVAKYQRQKTPSSTKTEAISPITSTSPCDCFMNKKLQNQQKHQLNLSSNPKGHQNADNQSKALQMLTL